jgi:hypothetical protein
MPPKIGGIAEIVCREKEREAAADREIDSSRPAQAYRDSQTYRDGEREQNHDQMRRTEKAESRIEIHL